MNTTTTTTKNEPMTKAAYDALPEIIKRFIPWEHASQRTETAAPSRALRVIVRAARGKR